MLFAHIWQGCKKFLKFICTPLVFIPFVSSSCISNFPIIVDKEIAKHDDNAWETAINEIANTDCPTIYLTADASYPLMLQSLIYYTSSELSRIINNQNTFADQIMLISFKNFKYKTNEEGTQYNYSYKNLLGDASGHRSEYKDILKYGVVDGDHMVITNLEDFNNEKSYSSQADDWTNAYWLYTWDTTAKILEKIYSMYDSYTPNQKFNFVITDWLLQDFVEKINETLNLQRTIYSRANKLYFVSDGGYSYLTWPKIYGNAFRQYGYVNCATQREWWNDIHNYDIDNISKNNLIKKDPIAILNNEQYCLFLGNDGDFYRACYGENNLSPSTMTKYAYANINFLSYKSIFDLSDEIFNSLCYSIISYFDNKNADEFVKDEDNFINLYATNDTKNHFDNNKKSIIIPTPSFIVDTSEVRDKNIIDIFKKIIEFFPPSKYNYVLKSHPRIDEDLYDKRMQVLFSNFYNYITILKPKYPLEQLIVFDWFNHSKPSINNYCLMDPLSYANNDASCFIGGWSIETTSIISMINLIANYQLEDHSVIGNKNAIKMINNLSIFIPKNFYIPDGTVGEKVLENVLFLIQSYSKFFTLGKFIDLNLFYVI